MNPVLLKNHQVSYKSHNISNLIKDIKLQHKLSPRKLTSDELQTSNRAKKEN